MSGENANESTVVWRIENYSFCNHYTPIRSPYFTIGDSELCLEFDVSPHQNYQKSYATCQLRKRFEYDEDVDHEIEIIDYSGTNVKVAEDEFVYFEPYLHLSDLKFESESTKLYMHQWIEDIVTVRCHFKESSPHDPQELELQTKIGVDQHCFVKSLQVPFTKTKSIVLSGFEIELCKSGAKDIAVKFKKPEKISRLNCRVICKITLLDGNDQEIESKSASHFFDYLKRGFFKEEIWQFPTFLSQEKLKLNKNDNSEVKLRFHFFASNGANTNAVTNVLFPNSKRDDGLGTFQNDLRVLIKQQPDIKLKADGLIFPIHKSLLIAQSPVFTAKLSNDTAVSHTDIVDVTDASKETMRAFIKFVYTDNVDGMDWDLVKELTLFAYKYQVTSLMAKCDALLMNNLTLTKCKEAEKLLDMIGRKEVSECLTLQTVIHESPFRSNYMEELRITYGKC